VSDEELDALILDLRASHGSSKTPTIYSQAADAIEALR
jgi:hypothetical protein